MRRVAVSRRGLRTGLAMLVLGVAAGGAGLAETFGATATDRVPLTAGRAPAVIDPASGEPQLAGARLHTGRPTSSSGGGRRAVGGTSLVDADAGAPVPENNWSFSHSRQQCRASRAHVPLSARGLMGGAAGALGDSYDCFPPRRVLVRVRAVFRSRTSLRLNSVTGHLFTRTPVREVSLAVRTSSGKPLAYAAALESGKARVFAAPGCLPE